MAKNKPQFAAVPIRAIDDAELTHQEFRVLAVIASHDRMSSVRGKGQGAWSSHKNMAARVGEGCDYARFSIAVSKLLKRGYLTRERLVSNRTQYTYRILYTDEDRLPDRKEPVESDVCSDANNRSGTVCADDGETPQIVCATDELSHSEQSERSTQYISLREEIDLVETREIDSPKGAQLTLRDARQDEVEPNIGAELAKFERLYKQEPERLNLPAWIRWLEKVQETYWDVDDLTGRAQRLHETVVEALPADLYEAWEHGEGPFAPVEGAAA